MPEPIPVIVAQVTNPRRRRSDEPIRFGVPFPQGVLAHAEGLQVRDEHESASRVLEAQTEVLEHWPDGSIRWLLVETWAGVGPRASEIHLQFSTSNPPSPSDPNEISSDYPVSQPWKWRFSSEKLFPELTRIDAGSPRSLPIHPRIQLSNRNGKILAPQITDRRQTARGPVREAWRYRGRFPQAQQAPRLEFDACIDTYPAGLLRIDFTLRNPEAAKHPGGLWDLGDAHSAYFTSLTLDVPIPQFPEKGTNSDSATPRLFWRVGETGVQLSSGAEMRSPDGPQVTSGEGTFHLLQESSGGEAWNSRNHVDHTGDVPLRFQGFEAVAEGKTRRGKRAEPVIGVETQGFRLGLAMEGFWQNFPSGVECGPNGLRMHLFPPIDGRLHELQPGEQKTLTCWLRVERESTSNARAQNRDQMGLDELEVLGGLDWVAEPAIVTLPPEVYRSALPHFAPASSQDPELLRDLMHRAMTGANSFPAKREEADEYGWRHFGDTYADHEKGYYQGGEGAEPLVSHYNNQYDLLFGMLVQSFRTGDAPWFALAGDLARHVVDIDIYHTEDDKAAYSGGLFWHTDHYAHAGRSTHRCYTGDHPRARQGLPYGGGPSNEHNYTTGLLHHYFLTGDLRAREAVLGLADWVIRRDDGTRCLLGAIDSGPTGAASSTTYPEYHGPGRGPGNSISVLLDAYRLEAARKYIDKAEELLRRCIHPADDLAALDLGNVESRWSYLVFLQAVGKYLDAKRLLGQLDPTYHYARASLDHYARWMLEHETPFADVLHKTEYPTETWPAHDLRKSVVFDYAALYGEPSRREAYRDKAAFFHRRALEDLSKFPTADATRPLAIVLTCAPWRQGFARAGDSDYHHDHDHTWEPGAMDFGQPSGFLPQKLRIKQKLKSPTGAAGMLFALAPAMLKPSFWSMLKKGHIA